MKHHVSLIITSLLTMLLATFHLADDMVRGWAPGGLSNLTVVFILAVWLYAALVLAERRPRYVILLVLSLLAFGVPVIHMTGKSGIAGGASAGGAFFFGWTLLALGVTALFSAILSVRGLWSLRQATPNDAADART